MYEERDMDRAIKCITLLIDASFVVAISCVLLAKWKLTGFLKYGKTLLSVDDKKHDGDGKEKREKTSVLQILDFFESIVVPRACFSHFYVISTFFSLVNGIWYPGHLIAWLPLFHSLRRLYESYCISKFGAESKMNISHYLVGIWFYTSLNLIFSIGLSKDNKITSLSSNSAFQLIALFLFLASSYNQYQNHVYLSQLVKYTNPKKGLFKWVSCAHYFDEILIYSSLFGYARVSRYEYLADGLKYCLLWVGINLSVSAIETRNYYSHRYQDVAPHAIIPFVL